MSRIEAVYGPLSEEGTLFCTLTCVTADGTKDGPYRLWVARTGLLQTSGEYTADKQSGTWVTFGDNVETLEPMKLSERAYLNGLSHGPARRWHSNGTLASAGAWVNGERDGDWETYAPDGEWLTRGTFDVGTPIGVHFERFLNGQFASKRSYDEQGRPDGEWCFWLSDGTEISCQQIVAGTGVLTEYDRQGAVTRISELRDGRLHGRLTEFTYNSRYTADYVDGVLDGVSTVYVGDCAEREIHWSDGKMHGPFAEVDCDTLVVTRSGQHCNDQPCGTWETRDPTSGRPMMRSEYSDDGQLIGHLLYGEDGQVDQF